MRQNPDLQQKPQRYYSADRVRKSLIHYLFGRGAASLASFATAILLIRVFPVATYAVYTALSGLLLFIAMLANGGIDRIIPRFLPELKQIGAEQTIRSYIIWLSVLRMTFTLFLLILLLIFSASAAKFLSITEAESATFFPFCAFALVRTASVLFALVLQSLLHQREATIGAVIEYVSRLAAITLGFLLVDELMLETVYWIFSASCALGGIYLFLQLYKYTRKMNAEKDHRAVKRITLQRLLRVGWHNYLYRLLGFPTTPSASKLLAASYLASFQTAVLGFSFTLIAVMMRYLPATLLIGLIEPVFMARYSESRKFDNLNQMAVVVLKVNLFLIAPAATWIAFAGSPVIGAITAGKYTEATLPIAALMVLVMIHSQQLVLHLIVNAVEETHLLVACNLRVLLLLPVFIGLIIGLGLAGLIGGSILLALFQNYYIVSKLRKLGYPYRLNVRGFMRIIIAAAGSALIASFVDFDISELADSVVAGFGTFGIYLVIIYFWKAFSPPERDLLNRFAGRKIFIW